MRKIGKAFAFYFIKIQNLIEEFSLLWVDGKFLIIKYI